MGVGGQSVIHYHGLPITPETAAVRALQAGHGFVSFAEPRNLALVAAVCQSFALDNGAFTAWKRGAPVLDWDAYYEWAAQAKMIPSCDFAVIPDVIDGTEKDNDRLVEAWPLPAWFGAPVWHMHESLDRLAQLAKAFPRVCIGSSGEFAVIGTAAWWAQMGQAMSTICNDDGQPSCRLHGLRMLDPKIFTMLPFASADSTNIGRNVGIDQNWRNGNYPPPTKEARADVMRARIESQNAPARWSFAGPDFTHQETLL